MEVILFAAVVCLASYFQGVVGFGQGLIVAPLAFVVFDKSVALTVLVVIAVVINAYLTVRAKEPLDRKTFNPLIIGTVVGLPFGLLVARTASLSALQLGAGMISIATAALLVFYRVKLVKRRWHTLLAGALSGFMQTSTTLSGPPVALILTAQDTPKKVMRTLLPAYFVVLMLVTVPLFAVTGLLSGKGALIGLLAAPLVLISAYIGGHHGDTIEQGKYRFLTLGTVFIAGAFAVYHGVSKLL